MIARVASGHKEDLIILKKLIKSGKIKPVIDKTFTLEQTAEAQICGKRAQKMECNHYN